MAVDPINEVWRGGVNAWECDDMGHMNTRFYVQRAGEGIQMLFARLGLCGLFDTQAKTTVLVEELHIRFHRELMMSTPLRMTGAVTDISETGIALVLSLNVLDSDECSATFRVRLRHVDVRAETDHVEWPHNFLDLARTQAIQLPENARPRSTECGNETGPMTLPDAHEMGLVLLAMGVIGPARADIFGRMAIDAFIGSVSDGIRSLTPPYREIVTRHAPEQPNRPGGAVLEARIIYTAWPRIGDAFEIRSGLASSKGHTYSLIHRMFDPISGRSYGSMQSVAVTFDLDRRKLVPITEAAHAELQTHFVAGLSL